ncbi:MAG: universal stress protein [Planctomycetes bacterium]|nr:universal stress protein [Planctomycetota bacterium]
MQNARKILVGVDLSHGDRLAASELNEPTQEAVRRAIWLAAQQSSALTFYASLDISAQTEEVLHELEQSTRTVEDESKGVLQELVDRAKAEGVADATAKLELGSPWEGMIRQVLQNNYDLVVVGTRGHGRAARMIFGSTAMKLLRNCPCPVWVTKPDPNWDDLNILVASDFSDVSQEALNMAVNAGQLTDAKIHLMHALEDGVGQQLWLRRMPRDKIEDYQQKTKQHAEERLHEQLSQTDYRTLPHGVMVHVVDGPPDIAIVDAIEQHGIDLLMMGTAARSGIAGFLIGNTAEQLLAQVPCSVVAIKPADFECPVQLDS